MNLINNLLQEPSSVQAIVVIFLIMAMGHALGKLKIKGVSLGVTFVFFCGISHHLREDFQVITDITGVNEAVPHGFLDFFITKHVVQGIRNAFHFFQHLAGIGHKLVDISA